MNMREYYEKLYAAELDNLGKMDTFIERHINKIDIRRNQKILFISRNSTRNSNLPQSKTQAQMAPLLNSILYLKNNANSKQNLPKYKEHVPTHSMNSVLS